MINQTIKTVTGLSLAQLADIIGVSKSSIHYAEKENRLLPGGASLKLGKLEIDRENPEKLEKATRPLRERELNNLDILLKKEKAHIHRLKRIILNKETALDEAKHSFKKRLTGVQSGYLGLEMSKADNAPKEKLDLQNLHLVNAVGAFHAKGPAKQVALHFEIDRLKAEHAYRIIQMDKLVAIVDQLKRIRVNDWQKLLGQE